MALVRYSALGRTLCFLTWVLLLLRVTDGKGQVTLQLIQYANPSGKDATGGCCEGVFNCKDLCDPLFKVCYMELPNTAQKCPVETSHYENMNLIQFGSAIGKLKNPITFSFDHFQSSLRLTINVMDHDSGVWFGSNDNIETIGHDFPNSLSFNSSSSGTTLTMAGSRIRIQVKVQVKCDPDYYDHGCGTYCRAQDAPTHYTCSNAGKKICLSHWAGSNCDIWDYCHNNLCRNGAHCINKQSLYTCDCVKGYTGKYCEIPLTTTPETTPTTTKITTTAAATTTTTTTTPTTTICPSTSRATIKITTSTTATTTSTTTTLATTIPTTSSTITTTTTTASRGTVTTVRTTPMAKVANASTATTLTLSTSTKLPVQLQPTTDDTDMTLPIILGSGGVVALMSCLLMTFLLRRKCKRQVEPKSQAKKIVRTKARYNIKPPRR